MFVIMIMIDDVEKCRKCRNVDDVVDDDNSNNECDNNEVRTQ